MLVLLAIVLAAVAAVFYLRSQTQEFASTATVQLASPSQQNLQVTAGPNLQLVTGDAAAKAAAATLGRPGATALADKIDASYDQTANVVAITATTSPRSDAAPLANAFAKAYVTILTQEAATSLKSLETQLSQISAQITKLQGQSRAAPNDTVIKTRLTNAQTLYGVVSTQILEAQIAPPPATVLGAASGTTATGTSTPKVLLLAVVIGLLAGCGIALVREQLDRTIRSDEDVEAVTGNPVLNRVPYVRAFRHGSSELPVVDSPRSAFAEAIRELRTSSAVLLRSSDTPVLVITSPAPLDGKSLITANLAASWALSGARVVLVDGDLRRPRIHEFFLARDAAKGLAEILDGRSATPDEADGLIHDTKVPGLRFLPAGNAQGDPADGLASTTMDSVIEQLQSQFDIVIIDAPPVLAVADAAIIAERAAGVILVVRAKKTDQRELAETVKRLDTSSVTVLGVVLNRATTQVGSAYGSYYLANRDAGDAEPLFGAEESEESGAEYGARYGVRALVPGAGAADAGGRDEAGHPDVTEPAPSELSPTTVVPRPVIPVRAPEPETAPAQVEPEIEVAPDEGIAAVAPEEDIAAVAPEEDIAAVEPEQTPEIAPEASEPEVASEPEQILTVEPAAAEPAQVAATEAEAVTAPSETAPSESAPPTTVPAEPRTAPVPETAAEPVRRRPKPYRRPADE